jgi:hypothetical protein
MSIESESELTWECYKCHKKYFDEDVLKTTPNYVFDHFEEALPHPSEPKLYWLGINEPVCEGCAVEIGIPPIDEGDE